MEGVQIHQQKKFLTLIASIAALGGFLFGYDTGIISGALAFIQQTYHVSTLTQEIIVSSVVFGALIGAIFSGRLADHFGRKRMLSNMAIMFIVGTLLSTCATSVAILVIGRFIIGIAIGITSYVCPLYISEMAPAEKRGGLVLLNGIMITGGEAVSFLMDYILTPTHSWRLMFATGLLPAVLFLIGMAMLPCSPRWMILKGQTQKAREILSRIRKPDQVCLELNEIEKSISETSYEWSTLFSKWIRPALIIGIVLGVCAQFMGINTVMYYGPSIFKSAGFVSYKAQILATFGMGMVNTIMTIISVFIVDKMGRRKMLFCGLTMAGISLTIISFIFTLNSHSILLTWLTFLFMITYIAGYCMSVGSLFWLIIAEIYPLHIRGMAMSFVTAVQWGANFLVAVTFLSLLNFAGPAFTFLLYSTVCVIGLIFCYHMVPETRGVSLEQIEKNLRLGISSKELGKITV